MRQPLDHDHVLKICRLLGEDRCCSFLVHGQEFECAKEDSSLFFQIEGLRMVGRMNAMGDHCSGPPEFKEREE